MKTATATAQATRQFRSLAKQYYNAILKIEALKQENEALKKKNEALKTENEAILQLYNNMSQWYMEMQKRYSYIVEAVHEYLYSRYFDSYNDRGDVDDLTREAGLMELEKRNIDRNLTFVKYERFVLEHLKYL